MKIVQQHRHQVKVRTVKGLEGWTDERLLLDEAAYQAIQQLSQRMKGFSITGRGDDERFAQCSYGAAAPCP